MIKVMMGIKPFWTRVSNCIDAQKEMYAFYVDGIKTGPVKEVRMHCVEEYNRFKGWGF